MKRALLAALLLWTACAGASARQGLPEGRVAGRFVGLAGEGVSLASLRGRVVLVTVLTTWNDLALMEVPLFEALQARHADEFQVLCVVLDEDPKMREIFASTFSLSYPVVAPDDPARFTSQAGPFGPISMLPTSVLLDRAGYIAARSDGLWSAEALRAAVERLVADRGPP